MNLFDSTQLDKCLRKRCSYDQQHKNPPPQLRTAAIAKHYGKTEAEIAEMLKAMNPERRDA